MGDSGKMVARQENLSINSSYYSLGHLEVRTGHRQQRVSTGGWANALSSPSVPGAPDSPVFPSATQVRGFRMLGGGGARCFIQFVSTG